MRIVVLDGYTSNPGDLDWNSLMELGDCTIYDRTAPEELLARIQTAEIVLTNKVGLDRSTIDQATNLRYIGVMATGYNLIDLIAAHTKSAIVTNVPGYSTASTAQGTIALLLELTNHVGAHSTSVQDGRWRLSKDFCYWSYPIVELDRLTIGIIGYGAIGKKVAMVARALGMRVLVNRPSTVNPPADSDISFVGLDALFSEADVISLHCPLKEETAGLINRVTLKLMKRSALFLNTARGGLVVEEDLAEALNDGVIAGAALDVLRIEPPRKENPLLSARNCIITPHNHWASVAARRRLITQAVANVRAFLSGAPINVVTE